MNAPQEQAGAEVLRRLEALPEALSRGELSADDFMERMDELQTELRDVLGLADHDDDAITLPVSLTDEEWRRAIGDEAGELERALARAASRGESETEWADFDKDNGIEECQLGPCCANISAVRATLNGARSEGGLSTWERDTMVFQFATHGSVAAGTPLASLFTQLGIPLDEAGIARMAASITRERSATSVGGLG